MNKNTAGSANFTFGIRSAGSIGSVDLDTPLRLITFHIVLVNNPFLLCLADIDKHWAFFNNITNQVIESKTQPARSHPVIQRYGHAFLLWYTSEYTLATESLALNPCYLTDVELRRLQRRFGHPSVHRLNQLLERSGHVVELQALQYLTRYYEKCQKYGRSPGRFTFTHHKEKLRMTESTYDSCLHYRSGPLGIVGIKTDDKLILVDNDFASIEEEAIKQAKIMTIDCEYVTSAQPIKFNRAQIKLDSDGIILTKESHIDGILLVTDHDADSTSSRGITRKKLSTKEQYWAQRAIGAYIASVCQPEAFLIFFQLLKKLNSRQTISPY